MGMTVGQITKVAPMDPFSTYNIYVEFELKRSQLRLHVDGRFACQGGGGGLPRPARGRGEQNTGGHAIYIFHPAG